MKLQKCIAHESSKELMQNFEDLFYIVKQSSPCTFLICMTASLTGTVIKISLLCNSKNFTVNNKSAIYLHSFKEGLVLISTHCQAFINLHKQLEQFIWWKNDFIIIWSSSNLKLQSRATRLS